MNKFFKLLMVPILCFGVIIPVSAKEEMPSALISEIQPRVVARNINFRDPRNFPFPTGYLYTDVNIEGVIELDSSGNAVRDNLVVSLSNFDGQGVNGSISLVSHSIRYKGAYAVVTYTLRVSCNEYGTKNYTYTVTV